MMGLPVNYSALTPFGAVPSSSCRTDRRHGNVKHIAVPFRGGTSLINVHGPRRQRNVGSRTCRAQAELMQGVKEVVGAAGQSEVTWQIVAGSIGMYFITLKISVVSAKSCFQCACDPRVIKVYAKCGVGRD